MSAKVADALQSVTDPCSVANYRFTRSQVDAIVTVTLRSDDPAVYTMVSHLLWWTRVEEYDIDMG